MCVVGVFTVVLPKLSAGLEAGVGDGKVQPEANADTLMEYVESPYAMKRWLFKLVSVS